jgi:hypothetical protein
LPIKIRRCKAVPVAPGTLARVDFPFWIQEWETPVQRKGRRIAALGWTACRQPFDRQLLHCERLTAPADAVAVMKGLTLVLCFNPSLMAIERLILCV